MKTRMKLMVAMLGAWLMLAGCGGSEGSSWMTVDSDGVTSVQAAALSASLTALPLESLSTAEQDSLIYMREEEKLAHDVYAQLDAQWGSSVRIFGKIAASETTHTEAVRQLLLRYAVFDPAADKAPGVFVDWTLQQLYADLLSQGGASLVDALKVGAAIEEIDMLDIDDDMLTIDNQDIALVYQNLLKGSRNHLRAFVSTLAAHGVTYEPKYLDLADYKAIIESPIER